MKHQRIIILAAILASVSPLPMSGKDDTRNNISQMVMLDATGNRFIKTIHYYDELGRKEETVLCNAAPNGSSIVSYIVYDMAGRKQKVYLPSVAETGEEFVALPQVQTLASSTYGGDQAPYSLVKYEQSALDRVQCNYGAGQEWQNNDKGVKSDYLINSSTVSMLKCFKYSVDNTYESGETSVTISNTGCYAQGSLYVSRQEDEDGHIVLKFTDKQGRMLLQRSITGSGGDQSFADTYYVYDDRDQLTAVIPPLASVDMKSSGSWNSEQSDPANPVKRYVFLYSYDRKGRCVAKKLPGCAWQQFHYDKGSQLVYTQNGNLRKDSKMMVSLCDSLGRNVITGLVNVSDVVNLDNSVVFATFVGDGGDKYGYTVNSGISLTDIDILSVNYYDSYDYLTTFATAVGDALAYHEESGYDVKYEAAVPELSARGMLTGTATRVLGDTTMLVCSMYYDHHGKVIQTHETNALGGFEHTYSLLSFTGKPLEVMRVHTTADTTMTEVYSYTYDNMDRLLTTKVKHGDDSWITLASNTYNSLGQLSKQSLGGHDNGVVDYAYNVRGWTKDINSQYFWQTIYYEQPATGMPCYNGNISAMKWRALDAMSAATPTENLYRFDYDGLNRLTAAHYELNTQSANGKIQFESAHDYSTTYGYDLNGNLTSLTRKGVNSCITAGDTEIWDFGDIDNLSFAYDGNQLKKVEDECGKLTYAGAMDFKDGSSKSEEYSWDANGNMTRDDNKKITKITYNVLNLPERIKFSDGHIVRYTYDARGNKLQVKYLLNNMAVVKDKDFVVVDHNDINDNWLDTGITRSQGSTINASRPSGLTGLTGLTEQTGLSGKTDFIVPGIAPGLKPVGEKTLLTMDYCGNKVYRNGKLDRINNDYGYQAASTFYYYIKDYQSNVRAVIDQDGNLKEINNYYPYGGLMGAASAGVQPYKYGAKELDRQNGLDWYDFAARYQDPMLPRFTAVDPKAEKYYNISPYAYCAGNPVKYVDPTGKEFLDHSDAGMQLAKVHAFKYFEEYDPNYIYIVGHGGDDGKYFEAYIGTSHMKITADNIDKYLEYHSSVWKEKQKNNEPITIVFISCNTGKADGIAQQVSAKYKNVTTIAPSDILSVGADHRNKDTHSNVQNNGKWIHYRNGKKIGTKPHNAHLGKRKRIQTTNFAGKGKGRYSPTVYHQRWGG